MFCSGKVYYDLVESAVERKLEKVAIIRIEQLYPFLRPLVVAEIAKFPNAKEVIWCQEEPMNQGAWYQIKHHLQDVVGHLPLDYAGRGRSSAPAAGHLATHVVEQDALVEAALVSPLGSYHSSE